MDPTNRHRHHEDPHGRDHAIREVRPGDAEELPPLPPPPTGHNYLLHILLFVATCITTTHAGLMYSSTGPPTFLMSVIDLPSVQLPDGETVVIPPIVMEPWTGFDPGGIPLDEPWRGLLFSVPLMLILLFHEFGHFVAARRHRVNVSLPYFIPLPFVGLGTFGAVISMRERIKSRDALMDIGAAGPLAGLVVAIPTLAYGLWLSEVGPVTPGAGLTEGNSLLYLTLKYLVLGQILPGGGQDVFLHPIAWAGWCGLLVTMINLIPVWQLDGGHVAFSYFGSRYEWASRWFHKLLPVMGVAVVAYVFADAWTSLAPVPPGAPALWMNGWGEALQIAVMAALPWFVWGGLLLFFVRRAGGTYHPPVGLEPLSRGRRAVGILVMVIFVLIFMPIPLRLQ